MAKPRTREQTIQMGVRVIPEVRDRVEALAKEFNVPHAIVVEALVLHTPDEVMRTAIRKRSTEVGQPLTRQQLLEVVSTLTPEELQRMLEEARQRKLKANQEAAS